MKSICIEWDLCEPLNYDEVITYIKGLVLKKHDDLLRACFFKYADCTLLQLWYFLVGDELISYAKGRRINDDKSEVRILSTNVVETYGPEVGYKDAIKDAIEKNTEWEVV